MLWYTLDVCSSTNQKCDLIVIWTALARGSLYRERYSGSGPEGRLTRFVNKNNSRSRVNWRAVYRSYESWKISDSCPNTLKHAEANASIT